MKRITVESVVEAQRATGLKLIRDDFGDGKTCGCPLTVLNAWSGSDEPAADAMVDETFVPYYTGFVAGVDGKTEPPIFSVEKRQGYEDGCAVRRHFWPDAPS